MFCTHSAAIEEPQSVVLRLMSVKRRGAVLGLLATVLAALILAVAPAHCSQGSDDDRASCTTVFGYSAPLP